MSTWPSRDLSRTLFADSQSRTKTWTCGGKAGRMRSLLEAAEELANQRNAVGKHRRSAFEADAVGTGKADAPVPLHHGNERVRVERWPRRELDRRAFRACVHLDHAKRACNDAQAVACEQRLGLLGHAAETIDELLLHRIELVHRLAVGE